MKKCHLFYFYFLLQILMCFKDALINKILIQGQVTMCNVKCFTHSDEPTENYPLRFTGVFLKLYSFTALINPIFGHSK